MGNPNTWYSIILAKGNDMEIMSDDQSPLIPLSQYIKSGKALLKWTSYLQQQKSHEDFQPIHRYGRKWLVVNLILSVVRNMESMQVE